MWRLLRSGASICCLLLFLAFSALWLQSYYCTAIWDTGKNPISWGPFVVSSKGRVEFGVRQIKGPTEENPWPTIEPWSVSLYLADLKVSRGRSYWGFNASFSKSSWRVSAPHWFLLIVTGVSAVFLKQRPRLMFRLGDILLFTTIVACVLGSAIHFVKIQD